MDTKALLRKVCLLEGCDEEMECFAKGVKWLCVEGMARYNELKKEELLKEAGI